MRVFIACEFSGVVRDAFAKRGHDAVSCDLLPTENPGPHIQDDVLKHLNDGWDIMIAFPPCTHLTSSGAVYWPAKKSDGRQQKAIDFVFKLYNSCIHRIAIENPVGILSRVWRKPDQIINPYNFGDPYRKKTCLWLKNLHLLVHIKDDDLFLKKTYIKPIASWCSGSTRGGRKKDGTRTPSSLPALHGGWKKRSLTFLGIAKAMAEQWG